MLILCDMRLQNDERSAHRNIHRNVMSKGIKRFFMRWFTLQYERWMERKKWREKGKRQKSDIKWNTIHISSRYTIGDVSVSEGTCYPLCLSQSEIRFYPCICLIRRFFGMIMGIWEPVNQTSACVSFIIWFFPHAHFVFAGIWTGETDSRKR